MRKIDDSFIEKWSPKFDGGVRGEDSYHHLISQVHNEIGKKGCLTKPTFISIINWKSPRVRPIFERNDYRIYKNGIKRCLSETDDNKLSVLVELPGIGAPIGSTILHFIYPDSFPIMDVRTCEALHSLGYISSKSRDEKRYPAFRKAILDIQKRCGQYSLRQIDKALFAYHKLELSERPGHI
jgi:hypothetical protein